MNLSLSPSTLDRMKNIRDWLLYSEEQYDVLVSRQSETASTVGWDDKPRTRPCECRVEWRIGKLCLACDNTGMRRCAFGEEGIDPYALGTKALRGGFTAASSQDESEAQRRSAAMQLLNSKLGILERAAAVQSGKEAPEDTLMRKLRIIGNKPDTLRRIERALKILRDGDRSHRAEREDYDSLPHGRLGLLRLSLLIPGKIKPCNRG